jgi:hypothetical protein
MNLKALINCFFLVLFFYAENAQAIFTVPQCVTSNFTAKVSVAKGPFNLLSDEISLTKERCLLTYKEHMFYDVQWKIDLCREPVHLKTNSWRGDNFYIRKEYPCREKNEFCSQVDELVSLSENKALIYAEGERETLTTNHGKFYCAHLLMKQYLQEGKIFILSVPQAINIFVHTPIENFPIEAGPVQGASQTPTSTPTVSVSAAPAAPPAPQKKNSPF